MPPYPTNYDILPEPQQRVWGELSPLREMGFVLYGGTALALRYGHRVSIDYDFFIEKPLDKETLRKVIPILNSAQSLQDSPNTLVVLVKPNTRRHQTVKLSFFGGLTFGRVGTPQLTQDGVIQTASTRDLLATKLKVLFDRVELKDYQDIAEILKRGGDLKQGLSDATVLFPNFNPMECLRTLTYYDDDEVLLAMPDDIRKFLTSESVKVSHTISQPLPPSKSISNTLGMSPKELKTEFDAMGKEVDDVSGPPHAHVTRQNETAELHAKTAASPSRNAKPGNAK